MKKYIAIGHWYNSQNTTSTADVARTKASFAQELVGNGFRAYVVLTEECFKALKNMDGMDIYETLKKLTSNFRKVGEATDYIEQCYDLMKEKLAKAEW